MNFVSSTLPSTIRAPQLGSRSYHLLFLTPGCPPPRTPFAPDRG